MVKNDEVFRFAQAILCRHPKGHVRMNARHRLILALLMSSVMVCMVKLLITFLDLGLRSDFLLQWAKAYFIAWPVAATTAFFIMPSARHHAVGATPHASHCWADRRPALMSCAFSCCPLASRACLRSACAFVTAPGAATVAVLSADRLRASALTP